jgi:hypothetical protein
MIGPTAVFRAALGTIWRWSCFKVRSRDPTLVLAEFDVTPNIETGPSNLYVIADGIASQPAGGGRKITVKS